MRTYHDISIPLTTGMVAWPGSPGLRLTRTMKMEQGDIANNSYLETDVHIGTHIDAPWHSIEDGNTIDRIPLDACIGPAYVAHVQAAKEITDHDLQAAGIPEETERLLIKTTNSRYWTEPSQEFHRNFLGLSRLAAEWVTRRPIRLIGIDYLSIQSFGEDMETHNVLLRRNVVVVEGLNLSVIVPGWYELYCLPLLLVGSEGAPARAVLRAEEGTKP